MWTLLAFDHRRPGLYRHRALRALDEVVGLDFFDRLVLSLDGPGVDSAPDTHRPWEVLHTGGGRGLSANIQQGWDALGDDEWVFHLECDFLVREAPLKQMRDLLEAQPRLAQVVLERQPLSPAEVLAGGVCGADNIPTWTDRGLWREQEHLFSFNPCVYHSSVATVAGVEKVVTARLRAQGRSFALWGAQGDEPRVCHIGVEGGMGSAGWAA